jgi:hypothetical protein
MGEKMKIKKETIEEVLSDYFPNASNTIKTEDDLQTFIDGVYTGALLQSVMLEVTARETAKSFVRELSKLIEETLPAIKTRIKRLQDALQKTMPKESTDGSPANE